MKLDEFDRVCGREWDAQPRGDVIRLDLTDASRYELTVDVASRGGIAAMQSDAETAHATGVLLTRLLNPVTRSVVRVAGGAWPADMVTVRTGPEQTRKKAVSVTWDGIPEHRNLQPGDDPQRKPATPMPSDPFSGTDMGAIATVEMFRSLTGAGMAETHALFYLACLLQVGIAVSQGRLTAPPGFEPPAPGEASG